MVLTKVKFKGHETFTLREGWAYKCLSQLNEENSNLLFSGINPISKLGVGNNMTKAIKYWMKSFNLIYDSNRGTWVTDLGSLIYNYDPYFVDEFTLWLLHINLASNKENATAWYLYFNEFKAKEFTNNNVVTFINNYIHENGFETPDNSIRADVNILLKTYLENQDDSLTPEDNTVCPLSRLGLIKEKSNKYHRERPMLSILDKHVVLYVISRMMTDNMVISIDDLEEKPLGLKCLLGISRTDINHYLDLLENDDYIQVVRTAGLNTIRLKNRELLNSIEIARKYYESL